MQAMSHREGHKQAMSHREEHKQELADRKPSKKPTLRDDRGMTTAEYAVGTVAAATLGGVLIKVFSDQGVFDLILQIILWILRTSTGLGG